MKFLLHGTLLLAFTEVTMGAIRFGNPSLKSAAVEQRLRTSDRAVKTGWDNSIRTRNIALPIGRPERKVGEKLEFELFDGVLVSGTVTRVVDRGVRGATWSGSVKPCNQANETNTFEDRFTLTCYMDACSAHIVLESSNTRYVIKPAIGTTLSSSGEGVYRLSEVGDNPVSGTRKDDIEPIVDKHDKASPMKAMSQLQSAATVDQDLIIDIGVLYTPESMAVMGYSHAAMVAHIQSVNDDGNAICQRSAVAVRYRLAFILPTADPNFKEPENTKAGFSTLLKWLRKSEDGKLDEVHNYRNQYAADFVVLFQRANYYGGSAYPLNDFRPDWAFANYAVEWTNGLVWAHELGHLQGCYHDRFSDNADPRSPFSGYGHCWEDTSKSDCTCYKSVMVYQCNTSPNHCKSCRSRDYYSNMNVVNAGSPTGEKLASCALHINQQRLRPITYRKAVHDSGMIFAVSPNSVEVAACASVIISGWRIGYGGTIVSVTLAGVEADILSSNINSVTVRSPWVHSATTEPGAVIVTTDTGRVSTLYSAFSFITGSSEGETCTGSPRNLPGAHDPVYEWNEAKSFDGHSTGYLYDSLLRSPSDDITISLWIQTTVSGRSLVSLGKSSARASAYFVLRIDENGSLNYLDYSGQTQGFGSGSSSSDAVVNTGTLTHVAFVKKGTKGTYYINGLPSGEITASKSVIYDNQDLAIGYDYETHDGYFQGDMDNIKIYNTALTVGQIASLYTFNSITDLSTPTSNPSTRPSASRHHTPSMQPTVPITTSPTDQPHTPSMQPTVPITTSPTDQPHTPSMQPTVPITLSSTLAPTFRTTIESVFESKDIVTFDGISSNIHMKSISESLSDTFSISMWITTSKPNVMLMTLGRSASDYFHEFSFYISGDGKLALYDYGTWWTGYGFHYAGGLSTTAVTTGQRIHIGFVKNGTTGTFYINGQSAGHITASYSVHYGDEDLVIGYDYRGDRQYFKGEMDNIKLLSTALSSSDMISLYKESSPTNTPTLVPVPAPTMSSVHLTSTPSSIPVQSVSSAVFSLKGPATFNGKYNQISVEELSGISTLSDVSISMWITTTNPKQYLVSLGRSWTNYNNQFAFYIHTDGRLTFFDYGDGAGGYGFGYMSGFSDIAVNTGKRTHIAFVKEGIMGTFYINGHSAGHMTASYSVSYKTKELSIGVDPYYDAKYFEGEIDHISIYNTAIDAADMNTKYIAEM